MSTNGEVKEAPHDQTPTDRDVDILEPASNRTPKKTAFQRQVLEPWLFWLVCVGIVAAITAIVDAENKVTAATGGTLVVLLMLGSSLRDDRQEQLAAKADRRFIRGRKESNSDDIWKLLEQERSPEDPGVLWGRQKLPTSYAYGHFAVVGSVGSGKTLTLRMLMKDQFRYLTPGSDRRALVYDAKQDAMRLIGSIKPPCPYMLLNPFDERGYAWDMAEDVDSPLAARELATILVPNRNESQPFFADAVRELLTKVVTCFIRSRPNAWTFREVLCVMRSADLLRRVLESDPQSQATAKNLLGRSETTQSIMATIATLLGPYESIAAAWERAGDRKISIVGWLRTESILILGNDERTRSTLDAINQLFVALVAKHALTMSETTTRMTWLFFDEFREAGRLRGLESLILRGRSKGCCCVLGFQDIQGVQEVYGERLGNELVSQCASKAFLKMESPETAEFASRCIGDVERRKTTVSRSRSPQGGSYTENEDVHITRQVLASQLMTLPIPDQRQRTGLQGYYLVRGPGYYTATYAPEQLDALLGKLDRGIETFVEAPIEWQYLAPLSPAEELEASGTSPESEPKANDSPANDGEGKGLLPRIKL